LFLRKYGQNKQKVVEEIGKLKRNHPSFEPRQATIGMASLFPLYFFSHVLGTTEERDGTTSLVIGVEGTLKSINKESNINKSATKAHVKIFLPRTFPFSPPFVSLLLSFTDPPTSTL